MSFSFTKFLSSLWQPDLSPLPATNSTQVAQRSNGNDATLQLPNDVLHLIGSFLSPLDWLSLALVCTRFRSAFRAETLWRRAFHTPCDHWEEALYEQHQRSWWRAYIAWLRQLRQAARERRVIGSQDYWYVKLLLVGPVRSGKTSLRHRFVEKTWLDCPYICTIGGDFANFFVPGILHHNYRINIWDTGGDTRFMKVAYPFVKGGHISVFVYAADEPLVPDSAAMRYFDDWLRNIPHKDYHLIIVRNKTELVSSSTTAAAAEREPFIECMRACGFPLETARFRDVSTRTGAGIADLVDTIVSVEECYRPLLAPCELIAERLSKSIGLVTKNTRR